MRFIETCGCGGSIEIIIGYGRYTNSLDKEEKETGLKLLEEFRAVHSVHFVTPGIPQTTLPVTHYPTSPTVRPPMYNRPSQTGDPLPQESPNLS